MAEQDVIYIGDGSAKPQTFIVEVVKYHRRRIEALFNEGASEGEMYQAGLEDGNRTDCEDLTDILFFMKRSQLGNVGIIEESNCHVIFKVRQCAFCSPKADSNCNYVAGFLAGALRAAGRPSSVRVGEINCGPSAGSDCVLKASW
jgi:predicted hydrocarbon binding protein